MSFEPQSKWKGREVLEAAHRPELDRASAVYEFGHQLPRHEAEGKAYQDYLTRYRRAAAAHHYQNMLAARAGGRADEARAYHLLYGVHARELGLNPAAEPPEEIKSLMADALKDRKFVSHPADTLPLRRSETVLALADIDGPAQRTISECSTQADLRHLTSLLRARYQRS